MASPPLRLLLALLIVGTVPGEASPGLEHFEDKVRPLLVENCYECHSAGHKIKGGLSLDHRAGWETGGDSGPALTPGDPAASLLLRAVSYEDRDLKMPPKEKLSPGQLAILRDWIAAGAPDPRDEVPGDPAPLRKPSRDISAEGLWSFQPLAAPTPETRQPQVNNTAWPRDPVDHHILAALEQAGLTAVPDAPPEALVRRLFFDLTGLPPSAEEIATFKSGSCEPMVDRLLASEAFAERWAQHWLDITRFAESSGGGRTLPFKDAWRFRDYVIESMHRGVPLDQMIREHLAGDLLPAPTTADRARQLTATAFLALGPTNYEEQDKGVLRMDIIDEQLETMGRSFMGMTLGCARCHDHKFDPVTTKDYYALAGIFRSTQTLQDYTSNVAHWIDLPLPMDKALEEALQQKNQQLASLQAELKQVSALIKKQQPESGSLPAGKPAAAADLPGLVMDDSAARMVGDWKPSTTYPNYIGQGYLHDKEAEKGTCTATFIPSIPETGRYEVRIAYTPAPGRATNVPVHILHADGEENLSIDQSVPPPVDGRFVSLGTFRFEKDGAGFILISNEGTNGIVTLDAIQLLSGKDRASAPAGPAAEVPADLDAPARQKQLQAEIKSVQNKPPFRPETMGVEEEAEPADCPVHIRGSIRNLGPIVPRGFIRAAMIPGIPAIPPGQSGRLQLAQWMTHPRHPLTARVMVNRIWMHLFGEGLVRSVDNFGASGETPTHHLLLDHLAHDFIHDGWSLKKLIRRLVLTRTYQLASIPSPGTPSWTIPQAADPDNRLLWRAHRRRLDANALRDAILTVSSQLDRRFLGPNVQAGSVDPNSTEAQTLEYSYVFTDLRRSVYSPAFRNRRLEFFENFDFADINGPIGQRTRGTIVPQALYFLNHPFIIGQSQATTRRLPGAPDGERLDWLWRSILGRLPSDAERRQALDYLTPPTSGPAPTTEAEEARWAQLVQALFATADFRFLD